VKLSVGDVQQLTVAGRDYCGNLFEFIPVEWTIPPGGIIAFDPATRTIRGVAPGTVTLSTQYQNQSASVQVTVGGVYTVEVIPSDVILGTGVSKPFSAVLKDKEGNVVVGPTVHWSSSAPGIASVAATTGTVLAGNQDGTATITAEADGRPARPTFECDSSCQ